MIRQAISCDICGTDKQQTNHWFVAWEQQGELRIGGWNSQSRLRSGAKHLCGQTCLHKLVDEFMAKTIGVRASAGIEKQPQAEPKTAASPRATAVSRQDASLTSIVPHPAPPRPVPVPAEAYPDEFESSARLIKADAGDTAPAAPDFNSRTWRAEAWKRERERQQGNPRRRSIA